MYNCTCTTRLLNCIFRFFQINESLQNNTSDTTFVNISIGKRKVGKVQPPINVPFFLVFFIWWNRKWMSWHVLKILSNAAAWKIILELKRQNFDLPHCCFVWRQMKCPFTHQTLPVTNLTPKLVYMLMVNIPNINIRLHQTQSSK